MLSKNFIFKNRAFLNLNSIELKKGYIHKVSDLNVYNSLTKNKEPLKLNNKNVLYWYSCGPTVYDSAHIGHAW
jgi:hypothetical protein